MSTSPRQVVIAGNWKMYKTIDEAVGFVKTLIPLVKSCKAKVYLAVPFTAIRPVVEAAQGSNVVVGAQNMNDASEGAFTGEIAARMLKDAGAQFVILGHSERRQLFNETNAFINKKVKKALAEGLQPILCIGETAQERSLGKTEDVLKLQITESLAGITPQDIASLILAYEPIWAIGTQQPATPEEAQKSHAFCREWIATNWDRNAADQLVIQYGGSVKPSNAKAFLDQPDVDGLLVGGASLQPEGFSQIVSAYTL